MIIKKNTDNVENNKPYHNIYFAEYRYENKNIINISHKIIKIIDILESNDIKYDIKVDMDFNIYYLYCYPKNVEDERLINEYHYLTWYSLISTVERFRKTLINNDFDKNTNREDIEIILRSNKFNL